MSVVDRIRDLQRQAEEKYLREHPPTPAVDKKQAAREKAERERQEREAAQERHRFAISLFQESGVLDEFYEMDRELLQGEENHGVTVNDQTAILAWGHGFSIE